MIVYLMEGNRKKCMTVYIRKCGYLGTRFRIFSMKVLTVTHNINAISSGKKWRRSDTTLVPRHVTFSLPKNNIVDKYYCQLQQNVLWNYIILVILTLHLAISILFSIFTKNRTVRTVYRRRSDKNSSYIFFIKAIFYVYIDGF